jgi:NAD(P)-dependent dehydrogenase (short-subunit alcohol dehydrogenase family)
MNINGNTVALVTGASSGIGREIVKQLLDDGLVVYAAARDFEKMSDLQKQGAFTLRMDVTRNEDVAAAIATIMRQHGGVDILVNNAGFGCYGALEDTSIEDARYQFEVNLFGMARLTMVVLPYMRQKRAGRIVNISSMGGKIYTPLGAWYHATKHAVEGLSDCLRLEVAPFGIQVIIIEPGIIETHFADVMLGPMMARSGNSAYAEMAKRIESSSKRAYAPGAGSPPALIAKTVSAAIHAKRPKTRYVAGKLARPLIFVRKWFGDRAFDKLILGALGKS